MEQLWCLLLSAQQSSGRWWYTYPSQILCAWGEPCDQSSDMISLMSECLSSESCVQAKTACMPTLLCEGLCHMLGYAVSQCDIVFKQLTSLIAVQQTSSSTQLVLNLSPYLLCDCNYLIIPYLYSLGNNQIGDVGARHVSKGLKVNSSLQHLKWVSTMLHWPLSLIIYSIGSIL